MKDLARAKKLGVLFTNANRLAAEQPQLPRNPQTPPPLPTPVRQSWQGVTPGKPNHRLKWAAIIGAAILLWVLAQAPKAHAFDDKTGYTMEELARNIQNVFPDGRSPQMPGFSRHFFSSGDVQAFRGGAGLQRSTAQRSRASQ
jgi:hypothetical protein